jgi:hypothetical protein
MCQLLSGKPLANADEDDDEDDLEEQPKKEKKRRRVKPRPVSKPVVINDDNPPPLDASEISSSINYRTNLLTVTSRRLGIGRSGRDSAKPKPNVRED